MNPLGRLADAVSAETGCIIPYFFGFSRKKNKIRAKRYLTTDYSDYHGLKKGLKEKSAGSIWVCSLLNVPIVR